MAYRAGGGEGGCLRGVRNVLEYGFHCAGVVASQPQTRPDSKKNHDGNGFQGEEVRPEPPSFGAPPSPTFPSLDKT